MDSVINWVKNLIFIILFTTLLEMFLPDSNMRKYVRIVMGFFIIMIFITPLARILNQDISTIYQISFQKNIFSGNWDEIKERGEEINQSNQTLLRDYYRERIERRIRDVIDLDYSDYGKEITVTLNDEYQLKDINILLIDRGINKVNIEPIQIGESEETEGRIEKQDLDTLELKNRLSQLFQIPANRIKVSIEKHGGDNLGVY